MKFKGRVISVCSLVQYVIRPLGLALTGRLIEASGNFPTIWLGWAWLLVTTALAAAVPYVRGERAL